MRVAFVCAGLNDPGGTNVHLKNLVIRFLKSGAVDPQIIVCSSVQEEVRGYFLAQNIPSAKVHFLPHQKKKFVVPIVWALAEKFKELRIDIVHSFGIQSDVFCAVASLMSGTKKLIGQFESSPLTENSGFFKNMVYRFINGLVRSRFIKNVAVSNGIKRELVELRFRDTERIEVIPLGIDLKEVSMFEQESGRVFDGERPRIGTVARLSPEKGIGRFIHAMPEILKRIPRAEFVIWGEGNQKKFLQDLAQELGVASKVSFPGWIAHPDDAMRELDIFVMPSLREGCPNTLISAMALACPVVASDIPGIDEVVRKDVDGILLDTSDQKHFADVIVELCRDSEKARRLGLSAYERVRAHFSIDTEIQKYEKFYKDVYENTDRA